MRKIYSFLLISFIAITSFAQTSHMVLVGGNSDVFTPATLTINSGDTVNFHNIGGYHNVNGNLTTYPSNPVPFEGPSSGVPWYSNWWYTVIFNTSGTYDYQCDPHVNMGMVGQIIVQDRADCNGIVNGTSLLDDCGVCHQAYIYNFVTHVASFITDTNGLVLGPTDILVFPGDPGDPYWNSNCIDCNGIANGLAMVDDCGVCQSALVYNYVTHVATPITDTSGYVFGPTELLVLPNSSSNPNWNSSCSDCNGVVNGTSLVDDCGVCQSAYIYNTITHNVTFISDTIGLVLDPTEILVMPGSAGDIYWNSSCAVVDCNGVTNGTSLVDDCGECQQAYVYNFITHNVTFLNDTNGVVLGPTDILVMPNDSSNLYWNSNCRDCNGVVSGTSITDSCGVCQQAYIYNFVSHTVTYIDDTSGLYISPTETLILADSPSNQNWNSSCTIDCNGVANGTSITDSCETCHQAYIYNYISHTVTFLNDTSGINLSWNELLYLPGPNTSPNWNTNCNTDCNGIVNGLAMVDDCGVCQPALVYNYVTHVATPITDTTGYVFGPTELLVLPNSSSNPNWNSSCTIDCNAIVNGLAMVDDCGVCQPALVYNYVTHVATPITDTTGYVFGPTELLVLPNSPSNPNWNSSCSGCTDPTAFNYDPNANVDDGSCIAIVYGCTDQTAINYFAGANTDDGSCCYVSGCTDPTATNYDATACFDDGSCIYPSTSSTLISACSDFTSGPAAWPYVLTATTIADGAASQASQTFTMNVTSLPAGGANFRVFKTTANGSSFFGNAIALTLGSNSITVPAVSFDRAVKFQFSSGDVAFDDLSVNGVVSSCVTPPPAPSTSFINACADFTSGPAAWPYVLTATTIADGAASQASQTFTMNVVSLPAGGANFRVFKTTANGSSFFGNPVALTLGSNSITVAAVSFDRAVKFQFSSGDVEFDALSVNGVNSTCVPAPAVSGCTDPAATNYDPNATTDDGSCIYYTDCNGIVNGTALVDDCGVCHQAYIYNFITHTVTFVDNANALIAGVDYNPSQEMVVLPGSAGDPYWNSSCTDCNGIVNGTALVDDCGVCHQAYIYNFITHTVTFVDNANALIAGVDYNPSQEMVVLPGSAGDPYWNSSCTDCNGIVNGTALTDSCGVCHQAYIYNFITHTVTFVDNANALIAGVDYNPSQEMVVLPGSAGDPYWNSSCTDCNGIVNGTALTDSCGVCHQAYIYNFITHAVTFVDNANALIAGVDYNPSQEMVVLPGSAGDPYWNSSCTGCTDPTATNYDPLATINDGSCTYPSTCSATPVTGVFVDQIIHNRATFNWDNMNSSTCAVDQMVIRYREVGTNSWTQKFLGNPVGSTTYYGTSKRVLNLTPSTQYEYQFKIWYVGVSSPVNWGANPSGTFTTLDECPNVGNFAVSTPLTTRATFTWDDSNGAYSFVRIKLRVDSISNPSASDWQNAGGFGINYGTWTRNKNGLTPGETYRGQSKTWCDPAGGPYKASSWTPLVFWTQPTSIRLDGESVIANLDVYPNPSRDIFNVSFTSEEAQDLDVRVINVVGEAVYTENLEEFIGEYTKQIDLANYTKGVYFLEITTNNGVVNKKLILQ